MSNSFITKTKPFLYGNGDINVLYGPWNSIDEFISNATDSFGLSTIPLCTTIAIKTDNDVVEYWNVDNTNAEASSFVEKNVSVDNTESIREEVNSLREELNTINRELNNTILKTVNIEDYCEEGKIMPDDANLYMLHGRPALIRETTIGPKDSDRCLYVASDNIYEASGAVADCYSYYHSNDGWVFEEIVNDDSFIKRYFVYDIKQNNFETSTTTTDATLKIKTAGGYASQYIETTIPAATSTKAGLMTSEMYQTLNNVENANSSIDLQITDTTYSTSTELDQNYPNMNQGGMVVYPGTSAGGDSYLYIKINDENWVVFNGTQVGTTATPTARIINASVLSYK